MRNAIGCPVSRFRIKPVSTTHEGAPTSPVTPEDGDTTGGVTYQAGEIYRSVDGPKSWTDRHGAKHRAGISDEAHFGELRDRFLAGLGLTLPYPGKASAGVYCYDEKARAWERMAGSSANPAAQTVSAPVSHFSIYAAMAPSAASGLNLAGAYVFPSPLGAGAATLRVDAGGVAERIEARLYNLAGELVESFELVSPTLTGDRVVYERVWAPSLPSGVYRFVVRAFIGGQATAPKSGSFALVR